MKKTLSVVAIALFASLAAPARADFLTTPVNGLPGGSLIQPLPSLPCVAMFCETLNTYISAYNSRIAILNKIQTTAAQYEHYAGQVTTPFSSEMNQIATMLSQSQSLDYITGNVDKQISALWPNYKVGTPLATLNQTLEQRSVNAISNEMKTAGLITNGNTSTDMTKTIAAVRTAGAESINPTEGTQAIVQMLTIIWEELVKEQQLLAARMSAEAQYNLQSLSSQSAQQQLEQQLVQRINQAASTSVPPLSSSDVNALFSAKGQ